MFTHTYIHTHTRAVSYPSQTSRYGNAALTITSLGCPISLHPTCATARCCSALVAVCLSESQSLLQPVALTQRHNNIGLLGPVALLLSPVAGRVEYLKIMFERRNAQAHVHVRMPCTQTKGRGLGV